MRVGRVVAWERCSPHTQARSIPCPYTRPLSGVGGRGCRASAHGAHYQGETRPSVRDRGVALVRELLEEAGWRPGPLKHLVTVEPQHGLTDAVHHVYWTGSAHYVGHPQDDFESTRREWEPLKDIPDLIQRGQIVSANAVAALLVLRNLRAP